MIPSTGEISDPKPGLPRYMPQLDGIRALAVLGVIFHHFWPPCWGLKPGVIAVYVFFILSGYLITRILLGCADDIAEGLLSRGRAVRQFYIRRFLRIFPLYYAFLLVIWVLKASGFRSFWPWFAAYLGNVYVAKTNSFPLQVGHCWTLAVEEQFYLAWPWVVLWCSRRWLGWVCVGAIAAGAASKVVIYHLTGSEYADYVLTPSCMDTLACGALLAVLTQRTGDLRTVRRWLRLGIWPGVVVIATGIFLSDHGYVPAFSLVMISAGVCVAGSWLILRAIAVDRGFLAAVLLFPPLRYLGTISYGIYVWHFAMPIPLSVMYRHLHLPRMGDTGGALEVAALSIVVASGSWWCFERPLNELKRYFPYLPKTFESAR